MSDHAVLFVCLGNICRSPLAEGVFRYVLKQRDLIDSIRVDSCGTGGWHVGNPPDPRSVAIAHEHGVDISWQRARQLDSADYDNFSFIVAMDRSNYQTLVARQPPGTSAQLVRFMSLIDDLPTPDVPDPYYGGPDGFAHVWELLTGGMERLVDRVCDTF